MNQIPSDSLEFRADSENIFEIRKIKILKFSCRDPKIEKNYECTKSLKIDKTVQKSELIKKILLKLKKKPISKFSCRDPKFGNFQSYSNSIKNVV